jgi:predicted Zn-dependent protease
MLNRVEKQYPNDPDVLSSLGTVLMRANEPAEALKYFDKVLQLKPNSSLSEVNAAGALVALGKKTEARRDLEKALELDPLLKPAVELLGRVYRELGDTGKATQLDKSYRRAMDIQTTGSPP